MILLSRKALAPRKKAHPPIEGGGHKYGCVMAVLPLPLADKIKAWAKKAIWPQHLAPEGLEETLHVTVKYGLERGDEETLNQLRALMARTGPFTIKLANELSLFRGGKDGDVLKVAVEGKELRELNRAITQGTPCFDKYPDYSPHITLAYLDPAFAPGYALHRPPFLGQEVEITEVEWSGADGRKETIPLSYALLGSKDWSCPYPPCDGGVCAATERQYSPVGEKALKPRPPKLRGNSFTGSKEDSLGRTICYEEGVRVPCAEGALPSPRKPQAAPKPSPPPSRPVKAPSTPVKAPARPRGAGKPPAKAPPPEAKPSEKAARAKACAVRVDKTVQRYAEEYNEPRFAKMIGGASFPDSEPVDIAVAADPKDHWKWEAETARWNEARESGKKPGAMDLSGKARHAVELKTMVVGTDDKLTMNSYAQVRKAVWEKERGATFHTVCSDDRKVFNAQGEGKHGSEKGRVYYYRRGIAGSARLGTLHKCGSEEELLKLMNAKEEDLPPAAKRTDQHITSGDWKFFEDEQGKGYRDKKTGKEFRAKK